jgi:hypothetical protein
VKYLVMLSAIILMASAVPQASQADVTVTPNNPKGSHVLLKGHRFRPQVGEKHIYPGETPTPKPDPERHLEKNEYGGYKCMELPDGTMQCFGTPAVRQPIRPGQILTAVREIGLPSLQIKIQPSAATLVNFDTIFYTQPEPFAHSVTLLDYEVDVKAKPIGYRWHHGDGTTQLTSIPGHPYPAKDITHRYLQQAKHIRPSVDVTYAITYRLDGGPWQSLSQTLQATGPSTDLEVKEAIPVLTGS